MSEKKKITLLPGDGIGPEIMREAVRALQAVEKRFGYAFEYTEALIGGAALDTRDTPLPEETLNQCQASNAVLLAAVGGPKWDGLPGNKRPEKGLLGLRKGLGLYANLRPVQVWEGLEEASTLKPEVLRGVDLIVVRELTGGIYFGEKSRRQVAGGEEATDILVYHVSEIERIVRRGLEIARLRKGHLTSVDKANVLESSRLWRETVDRLAPEYPEVQVEHMLVDNCAMQLLRRPTSFDVIVTENMFGDILSDEASMLTGSIGMLASASLGEGSLGLYEPVHGSAPDIAGTGQANPIAMVLSAALMLRLSFGYDEAAHAVEEAVRQVLAQGYRTGDIARTGEKVVGTEEMGSAIVKHISL
jgi:3-isopropylmalate dehydrogenase